MRGETGAAAICDVQFAVTYKHQGLAVEQLSYEVVVGFDPLEAQDHNAPEEQNQNVLQHGDGAVIDGAADDATEYIVLNLVGGVRGRKVSLSADVDDEGEG